MRKYVHYGNDRFDAEKLKEQLRNINRYRRDKPAGFWASPVDAEWGWKDFCEREQYRTESFEKSFIFTLSEHARILKIRSLEEAMPYLEIIGPSDTVPDYGLKKEKIMFNYDAMEVIMSDDYENLHNNNVFYNWDVDSVCIWNPYIIIPA